MFQNYPEVIDFFILIAEMCRQYKNIWKKKQKIKQTGIKQKMGQEQSPELENRLKNILQICVESLKPRLKTKNQISQLQDYLIDYQNNQQLAQIIENVVKMLQKYMGKLVGGDENKNVVEQEEYNKLEQCVQNLQAKQRSYIKNQNQMKLYCEELEAKVKEVQESKNQLVISTKKVILDLKRDNQNLMEKIRVLTQQTNNINKDTNDKAGESSKNTRKQIGESMDKLPKTIKGAERAESSLRSKLEQYQEVIQSIEASRGRKNSLTDPKQKFRHQIK